MPRNCATGCFEHIIFSKTENNEKSLATAQQAFSNTYDNPLENWDITQLRNKLFQTHYLKKIKKIKKLFEDTENSHATAQHLSWITLVHFLFWIQVYTVWLGKKPLEMLSALSWASGHLGIKVKTFWNSPGYAELKIILVFNPTLNINQHKVKAGNSMIYRWTLNKN